MVDGDPFDNLVAAPGLVSVPKKGKLTPKAGKPAVAGWWKRPQVLAIASVALLALVVLFAVGVFRVKTAEGSILVVEVNEPNPDVFVDGEKVTVTWGKDGKTAEISVKQGTRKVEVKKEGFSVFGEEVDLQDGKRSVLTARLVSQASPVQPPRPGDKPAPLMGNNTAAQVRQAQEGWAKYLGREVEEDDEVVPGVKMKFVLIPPGTFWMGSPDRETGHRPDEVQHEVTITHPFYLGKYEVTQEQYEALMGKENNNSQWKGADLPVEGVSWVGADASAKEWTRTAGR